MQILADQNIHRRVVARLREAGFDVEFILETMPGASDEAILDRPDIGHFHLITGDRDFGDLIFNKRLPQPYTILYSRLPQPEWATTARRLIELLDQGVEPRQMITLTKSGERNKAFPPGAIND